MPLYLSVPLYSDLSASPGMRVSTVISQIQNHVLNMAMFSSIFTKLYLTLHGMVLSTCTCSGVYPGRKILYWYLEYVSSSGHFPLKSSNTADKHLLVVSDLYACIHFCFPTFLPGLYRALRRQCKPRRCSSNAATRDSPPEMEPGTLHSR